MFLVTNFYFRPYEFLAVYQHITYSLIISLPYYISILAANKACKECPTWPCHQCSDKKVSESQRIFALIYVLKRME